MSEETAMTIVKVSALLIVGIAILSGLVVSATSTMAPTVSVLTFADQPADAETITLGDSTPMVF